MSILGERISGAVVADLFAGSGALGLEALSRGAAHVTFVERNRGALRVLERNIHTLGAGTATTVIRGDAVAHARAAERFRYDLALADPPYDRGHTRELLVVFARNPFARELWLEHSARDAVPLDIPIRQRTYGGTTLTRAVPPAERSRRGPDSSNSLRGGGGS